MKKLIFCMTMVVYSLLHAEPRPCLEVDMNKFAEGLQYISGIKPSGLGTIHPDEAQFKERLKLCLAHHAVCMMLGGRDYLIWVEQDEIEPTGKDLHDEYEELLFAVIQINDPRLKRQSCVAFYNASVNAWPWYVYHWQVERGRMKHQVINSEYFTLEMRPEELFPALAKEYEFMQEKIDKKNWK